MYSKSVCLSTSYLAPVQYYSYIANSSLVWIEQNENYFKQSYRNRCIIMDAGSMLTLTIPIVSQQEKGIRDVQISNHGNWQHVHWNAIKSAYNSSPFFEYYQDDFYPFYHGKYKYLFDFNEQLRELILSLIDIDTLTIEYTQTYISQANCSADLLDMRDSISPKIDFRDDLNFRSQPYHQVFNNKHGFVANLSIIDLLFNMGNESLLILNKSLM